jgi:hypothetical protein
LKTRFERRKTIVGAATFVTYSLNERMKSFRLSKIGEAPSSLGLYGWFVSFTSNTRYEEYNSIFKSKSITSRVEEGFNNVYQGDIGQENNNLNKRVGFSKMLNRCTKLMCPPIYIGISSNLRKRLSTHKRKLNQYLHSKKDFEYKKNVSPDTDEESANFALRVGSEIEKYDTIRPANLWVKVVESNGELDRKEVLRIEYFANRTFNPIYGKN